MYLIKRGDSAVIDLVDNYQLILRPVVLRNTFSRVLPFLCQYLVLRNYY